MQTLKFTILNLQYSHLRVFALAVSLQQCACPRYYPLRFQSGLCSDIRVLFLKGPCHHVPSLWAHHRCCAPQKQHLSECRPISVTTGSPNLYRCQEHGLISYVLSTYCVAGLGAGDTARNKTDKNSPFMFPRGKINNTYIR